MVQLEVFIGKLVTIDRLSSCTYYIHKNETQWHETGIIVFVSMSSLSFSIYTSTNMTSMYINRHHKQKHVKSYCTYHCGWWNHLPGTWSLEWHDGRMIRRIRIPSRLEVEEWNIEGALFVRGSFFIRYMCCVWIETTRCISISSQLVLSPLPHIVSLHWNNIRQTKINTSN